MIEWAKRISYLSPLGWSIIILYVCVSDDNFGMTNPIFMNFKLHVFIYKTHI